MNTQAGETTIAESAASETASPVRDAVAFLIPSYKTPLMASELLYAAVEMKIFDGCAFVLLLQREDPTLATYKTLVANLREKGLNAGFFVFDGTPYCGMINRVAPIINADCMCVLDNRHLPLIEGGNVADAVRKWLAGSREPMRVGTFVEDGMYPLVTQKLIDRLGYMFHPLCYGRLEAETWLLSLAANLDVLSAIDGASVIESPVTGGEVVGVSSEEDLGWVKQTLAQILDEEVDRLDYYLVR